MSAIAFHADSIRVDLPPAPYAGLRPFDQSEWPIFFGRERIVADLRQRLTNQRLVMVHGASGCGKSSVIRAGLLPRLVLDQRRNDGPAWRTAIMRPGGSPLWHLSQAIAAVTDAPDDEQARNEHTLAIRRTLSLGVEALPELTARFGLGRNGPVCLLLDQFEELFTYARDAVREEALTFVEFLRGFAPEALPPPGVHAVLTMRSDHLGDCGRYLGFAELVNRTQYLVPRMSNDDLLRAIREPARLYDGEVTPDLATRLIQDSAVEADALPLVQHCLLRLWQKSPMVDLPTPVGDEVALPHRADQHGLAEAFTAFVFEREAGRDGPIFETSATALREAQPAFERPISRRLRILDLPSYPGLREGLSGHADEVLATLSDEDQELVELIFRSLIDTDPLGRLVRRPRKFLELATETGADAVKLCRVLAPFRTAGSSFLTPLGSMPLQAEDVVDVGHESLIRCWIRINDPSVDASGMPKGWVLREQEAGRAWRMLIDQADLLSAIRSTTIHPVLISKSKLVIGSLLGNAIWSQRYGGNWEEIQYLLTQSLGIKKIRTQLKRCFLALIALVLVFLCLMAISKINPDRIPLIYIPTPGHAWLDDNNIRIYLSHSSIFYDLSNILFDVYNTIILLIRRAISNIKSNFYNVISVFFTFFFIVFLLIVIELVMLWCRRYLRL